MVNLTGRVVRVDLLWRWIVLDGWRPWLCSLAEVVGVGLDAWGDGSSWSWEWGFVALRGCRSLGIGSVGSPWPFFIESYLGQGET